MSNFNTFIFSASLLVFSGSLFADPFLSASCKYRIDKDLLISIAVKESSLKTRAKNVNHDGSIDVCMMQINLKEWLPKLPHISKEQIEEDVYLCVEIGAWVLAQNFESHGRQWLSIGAYNTGFSSRLSETREAYIEDIKMIYRNVQDGFYDKRLAQLGVNRTNTQCL